MVGRGWLHLVLVLLIEVAEVGFAADVGHDEGLHGLAAEAQPVEVREPLVTLDGTNATAAEACAEPLGRLQAAQAQHKRLGNGREAVGREAGKVVKAAQDIAVHFDLLVGHERRPAA